MKERSVHQNMALPTHHQAANMAEPRNRPLHLPPAFIAPQLPSIWPWWPCAVFAMGTDQINAASGPALPQRVRVTGLLIEQGRGALPWASPPLTGHGNGRPGRLYPLHFGGGRRVQEVSQRNPWAVDPHHPRRAFAPCGFANAGAPFFAGAKLPSAKAADPSSWPWASRWPRDAR
jgi:hypothetical protein